MSYEDGRKILTFDMSDTQQNEVFLMLDKIRWYQTAFITKLVKDFFDSRGVTKDTDYNTVKAIVKLYIKEHPTENILANNSNFEHELISMLFRGLQQNINPVIATPNITPTEVVSEKTEINVDKIVKPIDSRNNSLSITENELLHNISENPPNESSCPIRHTSADFINFDEDDDDDDDDDMSSMLEGFSTMSGD